MKTKFLLILLFFFLLISNVYSQVNFYVSGAGNDLNNGTSTSSPFKTLKRAYDALPNTVNSIYNIILLNNGEIPIMNNNGSGFIWTKSGTAQYPINITSESSTRSIVSRTNDDLDYHIKLLNVSYINFNRIHFKNIAKGAFFLDNADYCSIDYCKFSGVNYVSPVSGGHATIWLGVQNGTTGSKSTGNRISNNLITDIFMNENGAGDKAKTHAIYLSEYAEFTDIYNNTIYDPTSYAIHFWHEHYNDNIATTNIVTMNLPGGQGSGSLAFALGYEIAGLSSTITNNKIVRNFVYDYTNNDPGDNCCVNIQDQPSLPNSNDPNTISEESTANFRSPWYPNDPYWLSYNPSRINYKVVSGNFNGDGYHDDVAALYDNANGTTNIHVWKTDPGSTKALIYDNGSSGWWYGSAYSASLTTGRVVSGRMDNNNFSDIAAFYDYGNFNTQIHVWQSNGTSFNNPGIWWNTSGYNANRITNRVVSGNFSSDNLTDIAAFYDNGNGTTNLHVWLSNGSNGYIYQWSSGWWGESSGQYDVNKITGKVVSGDFNEDGKTDIAAFYDAGVGLTKLQVWLSTGTGFSYQGNSGWWSSVPTNFDASKITGRVVSNDFNGDGKSDIAAFYDNGSGGTSLRVWLSTGTSFTYQGDAGWWSAASGYNASNLTGRVVSGNFERFSNNDILGFFDCSYNAGSLRTNVWQNYGNSFAYANGSLGYPWLTSFAYDKSLNNTLGESTNYMESNKQSFLMHPNPTNSDFSISGLDPTVETQITVFDLTGTVLKVHNCQDASTSINTDGIPRGTFITKIQNGEQIEFKNLIKY